MSLTKQLPQFKWVKGHQDAANPPRKQSLVPAQQNYQAVHAASQLEPPPDYELLNVPPLPHTPCQWSSSNALLQVGSNGGPMKPLRPQIYSSICKESSNGILRLSMRWTGIPLPKFLVRKYTNNRTTIVKHIHNISPTGKLANRNNRHLPHECPACECPYESNSHVIQNVRPKAEPDGETQR